MEAFAVDGQTDVETVLPEDDDEGVAVIALAELAAVAVASLIIPLKQECRYFNCALIERKVDETPGMLSSSSTKAEAEAESVAVVTVAGLSAAK